MIQERVKKDQTKKIPESVKKRDQTTEDTGKRKNEDQVKEEKARKEVCEVGSSVSTYYTLKLEKIRK
jgi:hypothetical protein